MQTNKPTIKLETGKTLITVCLIWAGVLFALAIVVSSYHTLKANASPLAQVSCQAPIWCPVSSQNPASDYNELDAIAVINANDIWAVGTAGYPDRNNRIAIAEHYNGSGWTVSNPTPKGNASNNLAAVVAVSSNSVWAVGSYYINGMYQYPLIQHYSSGSWQDISGTISGQASCGGNALASVAALSDTDVWAVGAYNIGESPCAANGNPYFGSKVNHPYIQHCDLSVPTCTLVLPPFQGLGYNNMNGIAAVSITNVWAVGSYSTDVITGSPNYPRPMIWHYTPGLTNTHWITVASPTINYDSWLNSIDYYNANDIWAVGVQRIGIDNQPIIEHYDGTSWHLATGSLDPPYNGQSVTLSHVFVDSERNVWTVGDVFAYHPFIMHWTGFSNNDININSSDWQVLPATDVDTYNMLMGVSGLSGQVPVTYTWAVGNDGHYNTGEKTLVENIVAPPAPVSTTSYYETSVDPNAHYQQGCAAAQQGENGIVVLDYGKPKDWGASSSRSRYGTLLIGTGATAYITTTSFSRNEIQYSAERFADGYYNCYNKAQNSTITIAIGTSNNNKDGLAEISAAHAQAWANMVRNVITYTSSYPMIKVVGAMDIEPDFAYTGTGHSADYDFSKVLSWTTTFSNSAGVSYYNFGSTDAYPCTPPNPPLPVNLGCAIWSADQIYTVSWGIPKAYALPEIYKPLYASYWYQLKRYARDTYSKSLSYSGEMTECLSSGCTPPNDFSPAQGWQTFWLKLNEDSDLQYINQGLNWSTDIKCSNGPYPKCVSPP